MLYEVAAIMAATSASESLETEKVRKRLLPRLKQIYETNSSDVPMTLTVLSCYERILDKIGRTTVIDEVLPILYDIKMQDPEIMVKVVNIYRLMLSDKNFGLSVNQIANRVLPSLIPLTVFPTLHLEQFSFLMLTIQEMLEMIDRHQKRHLKLGNLNLASPGSGEKRMLRHQLSSDSMTFSPFTLIPNVRIQDSKMSTSAEDFLSRRGSASAGYLGLSRSGIYYRNNGVFLDAILPFEVSFLNTSK
ncbi:SCY1-like protein 2 [Armadillidium vulgare]|nr:SCY1-like protein 2 [Armadillidium vulgare]